MEVSTFQPIEDHCLKSKECEQDSLCKAAASDYPSIESTGYYFRDNQPEYTLSSTNLQSLEKIVKPFTATLH